jgi:endoglucanase
LQLAILQAKGQTYNNLEHVIVHNSDDYEANECARKAKIYLEKEARVSREAGDGVRIEPIFIEKKATEKSMSLGDLRNYGLEKCTGKYVVVWDDDDLYSKKRVEVQVKAIKARAGHGIVASSLLNLHVNEINSRGLNANPPRLPRRFLIHDRQHTGWEPSLCCLLEAMPKYDNKDTAEDTRVVNELSEKKKLHVMECHDMYIYMRQGGNAAAAELEEPWWHDRQKTFDLHDMIQLVLEFGIIPEFLAKPLLERGIDAMPMDPPHGHLQVKAGKIFGESGEEVQIHGMSLFWSQWKRKYWNHKVLAWLQKDWNINVVRAAMGVEDDRGYMEKPEMNEEAVTEVVLSCLALGLYVVIDWHSHKAIDTKERKTAAKTFFESVAKRFGRYPHVIFETWNEPDRGYSWDEHVKPFHIELNDIIRQHSDNIIAVSVPMWSQKVEAVLTSGLPPHDNLVISMHGYMCNESHVHALMNSASNMLKNKYAIMVTEWGPTHPENKHPLKKRLSDVWVGFLNYNQISHITWSVSDKDGEHLSTLSRDASCEGEWDAQSLTETGKYVRELHRTRQPAITEPYLTEAISQLTAYATAHGFNVFWPGSGEIHHVQDRGDNHKVHEQPTVTDDTLLTACQCEDGRLVFWAENGQICEMHSGKWNKWAWGTTRHTHAPIRKTTKLSACIARGHFCVFWAADGEIHEMHKGNYNGWKYEFTSHKQPTVTKETQVTACQCEDGRLVFWAGDGQIYEMGSGNWNNWTWDTSKHNNIPIKEGTKLSSCMSRSCYRVFWAADGKIHEMHKGTYNCFEQWEFTSHKQPTVRNHTLLTACQCENRVAVFSISGGNINIEQHSGKHSSWKWCAGACSYIF